MSLIAVHICRWNNCKCRHSLEIYKKLVELNSGSLSQDKHTKASCCNRHLDNMIQNVILYIIASKYEIFRRESHEMFTRLMC